MTIDPKILSTPFTNIKGHSYFHGEKEVLFSIHSTFPIEKVRSLNEEEKLFEVQLTPAGDDDAVLRVLRDRLEGQVSGGTVWKRLENRLVRVRHIGQAEKLYLTLLQHSRRDRDAALCYHQLLCQLLIELPPNSTSMQSRTMKTIQMAILDLVYLLYERGQHHN